MKKSILIFGAGINQLELIKATKDLDIISVVIDPAENPLGKSIADYYYQVDGKDYNRTKEVALKHKVDGIVTGQMENPLRLMARLAKDFEFIFNTPEVIETSLNKALMKEAFIKHNIPCAKGKLLKQNEKPTKDSISELAFPLIIKPIDSFSSRGVVKVNSFEEIAKNERETRSFSADSSILVEEFLEGREFSIESITYRKETTVIQVTEKFITPYPNTVEMAHLQPARITNSERQEIEKLVKKAILAIGIDNSASHAEVMLTENGSYMIEIGARLGGDFISSYLTKASTGISMDKAAIQVALGIKPDLTHLYLNYSMIKYIELEVGRKVMDIGCLKQIELMDGFVFYKVFIEEGEEIPKLKHSAVRAACILFQKKDYKTLFATIESAEKIMKSKILLS